jgi:hypothetical protein
MGEFGYMEDAESTVEEDIKRLFIVKSAYMSSKEIIKELAESFNRNEEEIALIVKSNEPKNETKFTNLDYLRTLTTKELDGFYAVLARQGKKGKNAEYMENIEKITIERNQANE